MTPALCTDKTRSCVGCQTPIPLPRQHPHEALPSVPENLWTFAQRVAGRPPLRKAEGRWPLAYVLDRGCNNETKTARGTHCAAHAARLAQGPGHDGTNPKAGALSRRVFDRGVRAATPRTGLVLASLAAMAPPRRPASVALPTVHRRRAVALLNALSRFPRWRADQARGC